MLAIKRSYFVSVCLLALAASIALTEYIMYSPAIQSSTEEEESLFANETTTEENEDNNVSSEINEEEELIQSSNSIPPDSESVDFPKSGGVVTVSVRNGDTFASILKKLGFNNNDIYAASKSLSMVFNLRNLKIGHEMTVKGHGSDDDSLVLDTIEMKPNVYYKIVVKRTGNGKFLSKKIEASIKKVIKTMSGEFSPREPLKSLLTNGVKKNIANEAVRVLGNVVNVRSSKEPINYEFLCRDLYTEDGHYISSELIYASVLVRGKIFRLYKFQDGKASEFVDQNGVTIRSISKSKSMLLQPIKGRMKITSGYGVRMHPVYGFSRRHTGIDIKASVGTPIYAAASGRVKKACYFSGYGKYVCIGHGNGIETTYGHLSKILVKQGQYISQGEVIGYSGNTGVTTGAHLHYEVKKRGIFINPLSFVKQEPQKLQCNKLIKFNQFKKQINLQVVGLTPSINKKVTKIKGVL